MAIKLTYTDGQESQYGDDTKWEVDDGVLKLGKEEGKWSVLLSPSHWAVIEVGGSKSPSDESKDSESKGDDSKDDDDEGDKGKDSKKDEDSDAKADDEADDKDSKKDSD